MRPLIFSTIEFDILAISLYLGLHGAMNYRLILQEVNRFICKMKYMYAKYSIHIFVFEDRKKAFDQLTMFTTQYTIIKLELIW